MKKRTIQAKKITKSLEHYQDDPDSQFDLDKLLANKFLFFEMEDYYGYRTDGSGVLRQKTIDTLLAIHRDWQEKLSEQNFNYYLAIWLYLPRIGKSQVVCAIEHEIAYYENEVFLTVQTGKKFDSLHFGKMSDRLEKFTWEQKIDLDNVYEWELNFPKQNYERPKDYHSDQRILRRNVKNSIKRVESNAGTMFLFPVGDVWIGKTEK